ncbi:uncharacterized protein LOC114261360 [Camellia sinensis]|uniref:uncharacterized protein LOC114261360 n=1 Tax=Camellia sinensis TaxID=4442 RepID=UPI001036CB35|nr:uncharacterized protein LOC114261360 [Camellia sinensis]
MTTHLIFLAILFELLVRRTSRMLTNILAEFALKEHNKKEKANLRLVRVVEASLSRSKGITYYNKTLRKLIHSNDAITYHIKLEAINDDDDSGQTLLSISSLSSKSISIWENDETEVYCFWLRLGGSWPIVADKPKISLSSRSAHQKKRPSFDSTTPWCRLLSQYAQNSNVPICTSKFLIGSSRFNDLVLKDQTVSANLCVIKQAKYADTFVAMLESRGMKGSVQVNGKIIKRGNICVVNSGDEVVFGRLANHAYIFQLLVTDIVIKTPSSAGGAEVQTTVGRLLHIERRVEDPSIMTGASILASLSSLRQDLSCLKPTAQASGKTHQGTKMPPHHIVRDSMEIDLDGLDANSETNIGSDKAGDIGETSKILSLDANPDSSIAAGDVFEERSEWTRDSLPASASGISLRRAVLKEDIYMGILDGKNMEVSFDSFPYYLSNEELVRQKDEVDVKVGDLQKELEGEWAKAVEEMRGLQKELEAKRAKATAEKESLKKELEEERAKAASKRATLQKELDEERAKAASERVAYPDLCVVTVQQFKGSAEFKMAVDVAVASSLARQESGRAGPSRTTAGRRTEAEVIESFQQSDFYKHEMAEFWDSGWKMFKRRAEELFPDLDLSSVTIGEDDVAQTPLDEGIKEEDLISSEEE